ncbi:MAG: magnesium chelatase ATPase subunit I [Cellvibrionales bacterium]|nr:magnesium chelatase ATPase subunit I [Cellvibrionales bacterium]
MALAYPFTAIVAQDAMKQALMIAAVDQEVGGVLVMGDRGTGKSTAIRALAALLPKIDTVAGCPYNCDPSVPKAGLCEPCKGTKNPDTVTSIPIPVVDLPLGATEDRVVGALDIERALHAGEKAFEPGLLARAHRGFLYIDEVNLLEDHIVDALLDVAASGENLVEREGLSIKHPSRFVLVGSGNPEEGELRPQLLDRFGLSVDVSTPMDVKARVEIIKLRDAFERDRVGFIKKWRRKESAQRKVIESARDSVNDIETPNEVLEFAAELCMKLGTDGLRGELTLLRASRALAALKKQKTTTTAHLKAVAGLVLRHRLRRDPLDEAVSDVRIERALASMSQE